MKPNFAHSILAATLLTGATLIPWSLSLAQTEPETPAAPAEATTAPAPAPEPEPTPEATPTPQPAKKAAKEKKAEEPLVEEKGPPGPIESLLINKLSLGAGFGLGVGGGDDLSADLMSFYFSAQYLIQPLTLPLLEEATLLGAFQYHTYSGVKADEDRSFAVRSFLLGAGAAYQLPTLEKLTVQAIPYLGFAHTVAWEMVRYEEDTPEFDFAAAVDARAIYNVFDKIGVFSGVGIKVMPRVWTEIQVGAQGTF